MALPRTRSSDARLAGHTRALDLCLLTLMAWGLAMVVHALPLKAQTRVPVDPLGSPTTLTAACSTRYQARDMGQPWDMDNAPSNQRPCSD